jgi:hypothetical protein
MLRKPEYDGVVRSLNRALGAPSVLMAAFILLPAAMAQINAAPPSVTSLGFGGRAINGTPPSVTSLGPRGAVPNPAFPNSAPFFGAVPGLNGHHKPHRDGVSGWGGYYVLPYGYYDYSGDQSADDPQAEQYNGGPTIFDRRGSGQVPRPPQADYSMRTDADADPPPREPEVAPAQDQPETVLVFKDGHQLEVENYAIVGNTLYDLTQGRRHKIPLSELDLDATTKENGDRGIDFQVPAGS